MTYEFWNKRRKKIISTKGGWKIGQGVQSHGYELIDELIDSYRYMQIVVLNATGRMPNENLARWFEAVHISMSWPDARIWCNRIAALGGSHKTSAAGAVSASILAADSDFYGSYAFISGMQFIQEMKKRLDKGESIERFLEKEIVSNNGKANFKGYARPIAKGDERIAKISALAENLGFKPKQHMQIAYRIEEFIAKKCDERMHLSGYISAFLSDQGYTPQEVYRIFAVHTFSGSMACYVDTANQEKSHNFRPLRVSDVEYTGVKKRTVIAS